MRKTGLVERARLELWVWLHETPITCSGSARHASRAVQLACLAPYAAFLLILVVLGYRA